MKKNNEYIVFNGDADGLCSANQFLLLNIGDIEIVTGVKRDIALLEKIITAKNSNITVFDIAVKNNLQPLKKLLDQNCKVQWFDHHMSGDFQKHPNLKTNIDISPTVNTSYIVHKYIKEKFPLWAITGLFGDNLHKTAYELAKNICLNNKRTVILKELGELLNYNAYGSTIDDLYFDPAILLKQMTDFADPFDFIENTSILSTLRKGQKEDLNKAKTINPIKQNILILPDEKWSRRVIGIYANLLVRENPDIAHAVMVKNNIEKYYVVSIRSPANSTKTAAEFCQKFPTGGGRAIAAGINKLPFDDLDNFIRKFCNFFD